MQRPLTVCHVITKLDVGGAQDTAVELCARLDRGRYRTVLVAGPWEGGDGPMADEARSRGVDVRIVPNLVRPLSPVRDVRAVAALVRLFRDLRPDVVHTHSSKAGIVGRLAARLAGVPVVVHTVHGWSFNDRMGRLRRWTYRALERRAARRTDALVVVCDRDRRRGLDARIGADDTYALVRSGIDVRAFDRWVDPAVARSMLDLPLAGPVVGSVTRLTRQKDPLTFVRAAAAIRRAVPDANFVLVGDGPLRADVEKEAAELGLLDQLVVAGVRRDVAAVLPAFDVFVLSSLWEGLPRVVLEAMAAGVPVVATDVDGVGEAVVDGRTGRLVPPADPHALAAATVALLDDPGHAAQVAELARYRLAGFTVEAMVNDTDALYRRLAP